MASSQQPDGQASLSDPIRDSGYTDAASASPASDSGYTDAASTTPVSDSGYIDASCANPVSHTDTVTSVCYPGDSPGPDDGDAGDAWNSCSNSSTLETASSHSLTKPGDPLYVDARSTDDTFYDARDDSSDTVGAKKDGKEPPLNEDIHHQKDDKHIYFILEKEKGGTGVEEMVGSEGTSQETEADSKSKTLAMAKVNVAARARMFEGGNLIQFSDAQANHNGDQANQNDSIYNTPPLAHQSGAAQREESIYEITFPDEDDQNPWHVQSSLEGSGVYETFGNTSNNNDSAQPSRSQSRQPTNYEFAGPLATNSRPNSSTLGSSGSEVGGSGGGLLLCKQGIVRQDPISGVVPSQEEIESEYHRLQFTRQPVTTPEEAGYNTFKDFLGPPKDPSTNEPLYECPGKIGDRASLASDDWSDGSWGSSEFEDDESEAGYLAETEAPTKPLPKKPHHARSNDNLQKIPALLNKLKHTSKSPVYEDPDAVCLPVVINTSKHPPPELPPPPSGLSSSEVKRRCVVELTISSERSYIDSLERIMQEYEKPILEVVQNPKSSVRTVFREAKEILNHHKMFQIQLSDTVKQWDKEGKIGDIFTASFSKAMLVDAYSMYVNNFAAGMDEIRTAQQSRPNFDEFLKMKEKSSFDRLSIFGLMVKPVQRFPQFIMLLQDLIKFTSPSHHDRRALQLALTELENVAHKLNERKRQSEQYFHAKQTMQMLPRQLASNVLSSRNIEKPRRLIRFDNFDQIDGEMENMKSSTRRLILMDDMLVCVKVGLKEQDGFMMERYRLKWALNLCDVELKDTALTPDVGNVVKMDPKRLGSLSSQLEKPGEDPFHLYADLRDMLHDLTVFGNITSLMTTLRRNYAGYNMSDELFHEVTGDLQRMIQIKNEQLRLVNSCSIILVDNSKTERPHYIMQTPTAAIKHEWIIDFNMAKLAIEKQNLPGWYRSPLADDKELEPIPAFFMKCVPVDVPRNFTKVKCAVPIFMPSMPHVGDLGVQHLWVCAATPSRGQVSVVSLHNMRPALTESFKACECDLLCVEVVSGCGLETNMNKYVFSEDTVWMANVHNEIVIFPLSSGGGSTATRAPLAVVRVPGKVTHMKFIDERLFCGLDDGAVLVYSRNDVGEWCIKTGRTLQLGRAPIKCQVVVEDNLWIACSHCVHVVEIDSLKTLVVHTLSSDHETSILQIVRCGVGVWVAFQNSGAVRLFHIETMENLQEVSVTNAIIRVLREKSGSSEQRDCVVTCMAASTGFLWIGTSVGLILTLPLPRLSDGVPLYTGRPSVAYHAHRGPVRFIIPVYCSSSIQELHKNSSLRSSLRARPSLRNLKREQLELQGIAEEKLLSSGTEIEVSHPPPSKGGSAVTKASESESMASGVEVVSTQNLRHSQVPERMQDPVMRSQALKKLMSLKRRGKNSSRKSGSLKRGPKTAGAQMQQRSSTLRSSLSFRSELANRIKTTTLGYGIQAQSMMDLHADDPLEVEVLFENLMDSGDISPESDGSMDVMFDDLSIQSDSGTLCSANLVVPASTSSSLRRLKSVPMESLNLSGLTTSSPALSPSSKASATDDFKAPKDKTHPKADKKAPKTLPHNLSKRSKSQGDVLPHSSSLLPHTASMRAHTMKKTSTSNAVMVLSGGDGYWDMHMGGNFSKNEDASLLFWIYKF